MICRLSPAKRAARLLFFGCAVHFTDGGKFQHFAAVRFEFCPNPKAQRIATIQTALIGPSFLDIRADDAD